MEVFKVLVIGPPNAGKTSLVTRFTESDFDESYAPTIGLSVKISRVELPEGQVTMTVMDLGGQDAFDELRRGYYRGAHYVIFLYDMTDASTFANIPRWYEKMCAEICEETGGFFPGAIVANKADLAEKRTIETDRGKQLATLLNLDYFETSAKTGENVSELFIHAASQCHIRIFGATDHDRTEVTRRTSIFDSL